MKIGLIVAIEMDSIFRYFESIEKLDGPRGYDIYHIRKDSHDIYVIHTGMGEVAASAGVQYAITKFGVDLIVNFGVVGGLTPAMKKQKVCVVERVVHYKYDCSEFMELAVGQVDGHDSIFIPTDASLVSKAVGSYPDLMKVTCCSGDKFVDTVEEKAQLHESFEGDVCDMESSGIVLTCEANGVPCLLLKAVSDGLFGGAMEFYEELNNAAFNCLSVTCQIINSL